MTIATYFAKERAFLNKVDLEFIDAYDYKNSYDLPLPRVPAVLEATTGSRASLLWFWHYWNTLLEQEAQHLLLWGRGFDSRYLLFTVTIYSEQWQASLAP